MALDQTMYNTDYSAWITRQVEILRSYLAHRPQHSRRAIDELDIENLVEELEDMGKSERRAIESRLECLIMRLLKWKVQRNGRSNSWAGTIKNERKKLNRLLSENPSLRPKLPEMIAEVYESAVLSAVSETNLPLDAFPQASPWPIDDVLSDGFWLD